MQTQRKASCMKWPGLAPAKNGPYAGSCPSKPLSGKQGQEANCGLWQRKADIE
jgi:hypothetical protein